MIKTKNSIWALAEVGFVLGLFILLRNLLKSSGFNEWQVPMFGAPIITSALLFFALPVLVTLIANRNRHAIAYNFSNWNHHLRVGGKAIAYILPATPLFPVIAFLGTTHEEWLGALILTAGFSIAGWLYISNSSNATDTATGQKNDRSLGIPVGFLIAGLVVSYLVNPVAPILAGIIRVLLFVGFLEEYFFRGYVQSRLNDYFGKPFKFKNVEFGMGLILAAAIFGLFHPLTVIGSTPWPWALWTAAMGLVFGFLREKTGSVVSSAFLHGVIVLPTVFFFPG